MASPVTPVAVAPPLPLVASYCLHGGMATETPAWRPSLRHGYVPCCACTTGAAATGPVALAGPVAVAPPLDVDPPVVDPPVVDPPVAVRSVDAVVASPG